MYLLDGFVVVKAINPLSNVSRGRRLCDVNISCPFPFSDIILSNSPILTTMPLTKKVAKGITEKDMFVVMEYIIANNQYIARLYRTLIQNNSENLIK